MSGEKKIDYEKVLDNILQDFEKKQKIWSKTIDGLANRINCELKLSIDLSAEATSQRQMLIDEKTHQYFKMYRDYPKLKQIRKKLFEQYSGKYPYKTNAGEKAKLIDADVAYQEAKMEYIQNYINFLADSIKTVDHIIYSVKNKIELYNATGLD